MADIAALKDLLNSNVVSVCKLLLPGGEEKSNEYRCASIDGGKGQSLGVHLKGAKAGVWADFNGGEGGDLVDLWRKAKGMSLSEALNDIRKYFGVEDP